MNREQFTYSFKSVVEYVLRCVHCRKTDSLRHHKTLKRHFYHARGEKLICEQLDVLHLMKVMQAFEVFYSVTFPKNIQLLLQM